MRRLIDLTMRITKPHHFRNLSVEARAHIAAWQIFIESFNGRTFFISNIVETSETLQLFTDASDIGMGGILGTRWFAKQFTPEWLEHHITVREFIPIIIAIELWNVHLQNKRIQFFSDNMAVVHIINKQTSKNATLMKLMRRFMVNVLKYNILFEAIHIPGVLNIAADQLSRFQMKEFHSQFPDMDKVDTPIPHQMMTL